MGYKKENRVIKDLNLVLGGPLNDAEYWKFSHIFTVFWAIHLNRIILLMIRSSEMEATLEVDSIYYRLV